MHTSIQQVKSPQHIKRKLLVILTIFISACSNSTNVNLKDKTNSTNIYYHEDLLQNKVKIYLPMTEKKLRLLGQSKVVQSNLLYIKLNRIIDSNCHGDPPSSPIFIIAETSIGSVAIEQREKNAIYRIMILIN